MIHVFNIERIKIIIIIIIIIITRLQIGDWSHQQSRSEIFLFLLKNCSKLFRLNSWRMPGTCRTIERKRAGIRPAYAQLSTSKSSSSGSGDPVEERS